MVGDWDTRTPERPLAVDGVVVGPLGLRPGCLSRRRGHGRRRRRLPRVVLHGAEGRVVEGVGRREDRRRDGRVPVPVVDGSLALTGWEFPHYPPGAWVPESLPTGPRPELDPGGPRGVGEGETGLEDVVEEYDLPLSQVGQLGPGRQWETRAIDVTPRDVPVSVPEVTPHWNPVRSPPTTRSHPLAPMLRCAGRDKGKEGRRETDGVQKPMSEPPSLQDLREPGGPRLPGSSTSRSQGYYSCPMVRVERKSWDPGSRWVSILL